jgi:hypothetical protein
MAGKTVKTRLTPDHEWVYNPRRRQMSHKSQRWGRSAETHRG